MLAIFPLSFPRRRGARAGAARTDENLDREHGRGERMSRGGRRHIAIFSVVLHSPRGASAARPTGCSAHDRLAAFPGERD